MRIVSRTIVTALFMMSLSGIASAQGEALPTSKSNAFNFNPLGLVLGALAGNYEHLFGNRHGVMVKGAYLFGNASGFSVGAHYRHHYHVQQNHAGLNSPFWGPFITYEKSSSTVTDPNRNSYSVDIEFLKAGANWGRRWIFGNTFNLALRIGYGFPFIADFTWDNEPENARTVESITNVFGGIDGEISIGFAF